MGISAEAIKAFTEVAGKIEGQDALKSLRRRARNTPSMIMTSGLPQTLMFILSKSSENYYEHLWGVKKGGLNEDEAAGYSAYLYVIMKFLKEQGLLAKEPRTLKDVIEEIRRLDEEPARASAIQNLLMEFLLEFKKLAEALIEE